MEEWAAAEVARAVEFAEQSDPPAPEELYRDVVSEGGVTADGRERSYRDAIHEAIVEEMERDENVLIMGEDIGVYEGTFRITAGMLKKFGPKRVIDTPIAEAGMVGTAVGMAMLGLRPVVEMMTMNFSIVAADQILNHAAKIRYFSGGQVDIPVVIRGPSRRRRAALRAALADVSNRSTAISPASSSSRPPLRPTRRGCSRRRSAGRIR